MFERNGPKHDLPEGSLNSLFDGHFHIGTQ